jgi:cytochrome c oxidase assembly protein subunit 11
MVLNKKKYLKIFSILFILTAITFLVYLYAQKVEKDNYALAKEPIIINLLTSVHPSLPWRFKAIKKEVIVTPGEVKVIEYTVENLDNKESTGIATFAYYPNKFGEYIRKLNCFCYDAQTLKPGQQDKYSIVLLIDPEVTKDSKTKNVKEVTIQFTFFDYKDFKENKNQ